VLAAAGWGRQPALAFPPALTAGTVAGAGVVLEHLWVTFLVCPPVIFYILITAFKWLNDVTGHVAIQSA